MTLRKSEAIFRLLVGIALALGFVGFVTHSHETHHHAAAKPVPALHAASAPALIASVPSDVPVGL